MIPGRIPFFEFDADPRAVLEPTHEGLNLQLPKKCVFAFLGDAVDAYAARVQARTASHFISATKHYPIHVVRHGGEDIALCRASVGAAPVAQLLDWLIGHARRALRDEGTSYPYAPPTRYVDVSEHARRAIRETMRAHGLPYQEVLTWSTDGFYRETRPGSKPADARAVPSWRWNAQRSPPVQASEEPSVE